MAISRVEFNIANQVRQAPVSPVSAVQERSASYTPEEETSKVSSQKDAVEESSIIAESEDGDRLTGEPKTSYTAEEKATVIAESEDGIVSKIEKVPDDEELITDLTGLSKSQVEQLYREGKISRYNYEHNMERREELEEEADTETTEENSKFNDNMSRIIGDGRTQDLEANALETAVQNGRSDLMLDIFSNMSK